MPQQKICPMKLVRHTTRSDYSSELGEIKAKKCEEEKCAWWSGQKCVVVEIAYSLVEISVHLMSPKLFERET